MLFKNRKRRIILLIIAACVTIAIIFGRLLFELDKHLSTSQFLFAVLIVYLFISIFEIIAIWWDDKHKDPKAFKANYDLIGKTGAVLKDCAPDGKVKIDNEIWNAKSKYGDTLIRDEKILVIDRQGLKLIIEKAP